MAVTPSQVRRVPGQAPIIPEIAQAYQNDPRTQIARAAINTGISGSPVAQGRYAGADAIARVLSGGLGGYQDRRMREQYGQQDDMTVQERAAAAQRALEEQAAQDALKQQALTEQTAQAGVPGAPAPGANVDPAQASAMAGALGAPAPATAPIEATPPMGGGAGPQVPGAPPPQGVAGLPPGMPPQPQQPPPVAPELMGAPDPRRQQQGVVLTDPLGGNGRVTSGYGTARPNGRSHNGLDYAAPAGTPIGAAAEGTVIRAWNDTANGGGNSVLIRHPDGTTTGYAHLADFGVRQGDTVQSGQPIGTVGSTGRSTGPHLHFTYRDANGRRVDPSTIQFGQPQPAGQEQAGAAAPQGNPNAGGDYGIAMEAKPDAPAAIGPTRSRGLRGAYELAAGGNPYDSARAQDLITRGLDNQTELDERAAGRQNEMNTIGYRAGLDRYGNDRTQVRSQRHGTAERVEGQQFVSGENDLNRRHSTAERMSSQNFVAEQNALQMAATRSNLEHQTGSREQIAAQAAQARLDGFFRTPTGSRLMSETEDAINANGNLDGRIREFQRLNELERTGTARTNLPAGMDRFGNANLQGMNAIGNALAIELTEKLKGSISDRDMDTVKAATLGIRNVREENDRNAEMMRSGLRRDNDFQNSRLRARATSDMNFTRDWAAYIENTSFLEDMTFDQWRASVPSYDAQGNLVQ